MASYRDTIRKKLAAFYAAHPMLARRIELRALSGQVRTSVGDLVHRNRAIILREVREGRDLTTSLALLARGGTLNPEQRRRLRGQLIDLAKTVPSLAVAAAPGGFLLLLALVKVLPPSLLPSALVEPEAPSDETRRAG